MRFSRRLSLAALALGGIALLGVHLVTPAFAADDLSISLAQSPASFTVGVPGTFTASIVSASTATSQADAPSATITLPAGFGAISAASNPVGGWTFVVSGQTVTATYVGTLPIAPATTLPDVVVTTTPDITAVNLSTVTATVTDTADANPADNTATLQAVITPVVVTPPPPIVVPSTTYVPAAPYTGMGWDPRCMFGCGPNGLP